MSMTDPEKEYDPYGEPPAEEPQYGETPVEPQYDETPVEPQYGETTPDYSQDGGDGQEAGELAGDELASVETFMANLTACMDPLPLPDGLVGTLADVMGKAAAIELAVGYATGASLAEALAAFFAPEAVAAIVAVGIVAYLGRLTGCAASAVYKEVA